MKFDDFSAIPLIFLCGAACAPFAAPVCSLHFGLFVLQDAHLRRKAKKQIMFVERNKYEMAEEARQSKRGREGGGGGGEGHSISHFVRSNQRRNVLYYADRTTQPLTHTDSTREWPISAKNERRCCTKRACEQNMHGGEWQAGQGSSAVQRRSMPCAFRFIVWPWLCVCACVVTRFISIQSIFESSSILCTCRQCK